MLLMNDDPPEVQKSDDEITVDNRMIAPGTNRSATRKPTFDREPVDQPESSRISAGKGVYDACRKSMVTCSSGALLRAWDVRDRFPRIKRIRSLMIADAA
jgi:hypothetical protein